LDVHPLIWGAKAHFEGGRTSRDSEYLKPAKHLLIDLVVSKRGLDKALSFANELFHQLEAHDCRVAIAPNGRYLLRARVDEQERPRTKGGPVRTEHLWQPDRPTLVYLGTVAIGLTVIEMSERAEARYVEGKFIRLDEEANNKPPPCRRDYSWTTTRDYPTGRICLQAYSADGRGNWLRQWRETKDRDLSSCIGSIVKQIIEAAPEVAGLVEEGERKAALERKKWDEAGRERRRQELEEGAAKARRHSRKELLRIVKAWAQDKRIEGFFADARARLEGLSPEEQLRIGKRLSLAGGLLCRNDALERFRQWESPEERCPADGDTTC
jgi:hypothetical protein